MPQLPLLEAAAVSAQVDLKPTWRGWIHAGTFPVAVAAGLVTLRLADGAVYARLAEASATLSAAVGRALDLAASPGADDRAAAARALVRDRFGIDTMAAALAEVYREVAAARRAVP